MTQWWSKPVWMWLASIAIVLVLLVSFGSKIFVADLLGIGKIPPPVSLTITFVVLVAGIGWPLYKSRGRPSNPRIVEA